jgi:hypothetical protein
MVAPVFIRYFARTDESDLGRTAALYCDALVRSGLLVRLVSTRVAELQLDGRGRSTSLWDRHRVLLTTPMAGDYVNVVCGELADWTRFHTTGVKNVLLIAAQNLEPKNSQPELMNAIERYEAVYAPSDALADVVERVTGLRPITIPIGSPDAVFGELELR